MSSSKSPSIAFIELNNNDLLCFFFFIRMISTRINSRIHSRFFLHRWCIMRIHEKWSVNDWFFVIYAYMNQSNVKRVLVVPLPIRRLCWRKCWILSSILIVRCFEKLSGGSLSRGEWHTFICIKESSRVRKTSRSGGLFVVIGAILVLLKATEFSGIFDTWLKERPSSESQFGLRSRSKRWWRPYCRIIHSFVLYTRLKMRRKNMGLRCFIITRFRPIDRTFE